MNTSVWERWGLIALICAWLVFGSHFLGNVLVSVHDTGPASVGHGTASTAEPATAEQEPEVDFATLLAAADPAAGEKVFGKCKSCHGVEEGGKHKVGPNLWNIVGASVAGTDFSYSAALSEVGGTWDYDALNAFLENPKGFAAGTKMTFAGLKKPEQRADVIAYMREHGENPPPLPEPAATAPEEKSEAAPVEDPTTEVADVATEDQQTSDAPAVEGAGFGVLLAAADAANGEKVFRKCKACHGVEEGGRHRVGPNLWNVVGRPLAHVEGFKFSNALSGKGGDWTYDHLNAYLESPKDFAPSNKKSFTGLNNPEDRADVILFLRDQTESPPPLP